MYKFSKDYTLLFAKVAEGNDVFCLVDYDFYRNGKGQIRDICRCRKRKDGDITFSVRGCEYGRVSSSDKSQLELFKEECEALNVEWVCGLIQTDSIKI